LNPGEKVGLVNADELDIFFAALKNVNMLHHK
jgi:hypothetical protein